MVCLTVGDLLVVGIIHRFVQEVGLVEFSLCLILPAHCPIEPPQPPMNIDIVRGQLFSQIELAKRFGIMVGLDIDNAEVQMSQAQGWIKLHYPLQQRFGFLHLIHLDIRVAQVEHGLKMIGVVGKLGVKLDCRLLILLLAP